MPSGGARSRSGPAPDPLSGRSDRRGLSLTALPAAGYDGEVPEFPLPRPVKRERDLWAWVWRTPQAHAWSAEPWRWHSVAMWARLSAKCETKDASASDQTARLRMEDNIGLSAAGLKLNGWTIAAKPTETPERQRTSSARDRFEVIDGGA